MAPPTPPPSPSSPPSPPPSPPSPPPIEFWDLGDLTNDELGDLLVGQCSRLQPGQVVALSCAQVGALSEGCKANLPRGTLEALDETCDAELRELCEQQNCPTLECKERFPDVCKPRGLDLLADALGMPVWLVLLILVAVLAGLIACACLYCFASRKEQERRADRAEKHLGSVSLDQLEGDDPQMASLNHMFSNRTTHRPSVEVGGQSALGDDVESGLGAAEGGLAQIAYEEGRRQTRTATLAQELEKHAHENIMAISPGFADDVDEITFDAMDEDTEKELEKFLVDSAEQLEIIDEQLESISADQVTGGDTAPVKNKLDEIRRVIAERKAARAAGTVEELPEVDLRGMISEVRQGLTRVETTSLRHHGSASAAHGADWNNNLLDAIKKIRGNMRRIERPSMIKHKWQNAAATLWVSGLTAKIKKQMASEEGGGSRASVTNPLADAGAAIDDGASAEEADEGEVLNPLLMQQ